MDENGYRGPDTGAARVGCAVAAIFGIVIGGPFLFIVTYTSGGCEGVQQPCRSDDTWLWLGLAIVVAACAVVGLLTRKAIYWIQRNR